MQEEIKTPQELFDELVRLSTPIGSSETGLMKASYADMGLFVYQNIDGLRTALQSTALLREALKIIRDTLDKPTVIDPKINCKNLTRTLQELEALLTRLPDDAGTGGVG